MKWSDTWVDCPEVRAILTSGAIWWRCARPKFQPAIRPRHGGRENDRLRINQRSRQLRRPYLMSSIATLARRALKQSVTAKSDCVFLLSSFASIALASLLRCGSPGLSYKVNIRSLAIYSALSSIWAVARPTPSGLTGLTRLSNGRSRHEIEAGAGPHQVINYDLG